ncbi:hemagglutinin repeat-containing protein [Microvirga yunnanensis]|uniref:hemagglutinin repeat-containing protein n=1 Tax=Microvirga yunnanensis TaxID=2953740 RepID=UPI0021C6C948|nr:hemagglutinin repeat-containing protein [Microvirga sp. HBU65207]
MRAFSKSMRQGLGHKAGLGLAIISLVMSLYAPAAMGQVISDPRAPIQFKPKVGASANGTPVIDIAKPSFGGISHNKFQRYDVDTRGVILNNSKLTGTSILGGKVVANPNLANQRPARVILNEVTSSATSTLNGPTEVFGRKADVIIANPNGVGCVGCSFINSDRVTLSTGTPLPDQKRGTVKFDVSRGTASVAGKGLLGMDSPIDDVDLIARQLKINGPIQAKDSVRLRAGAMVYDQRGDQIVPNDLSKLPIIEGSAIQSSATGKITAGTLSILSRDVDVGIDLKGDLSASAASIVIKSFGDAALASAKTNGDLQIEADGQITLAGNNQALGRITAAGKRITVSVEGQLAAGDAIVMEAVQSLAARGVLKAGNAVSLVSGDRLIAEGVVASNGKIAFEGKAIRGKNLEISGSDVSIAGLESAALEGTTIIATHDSVKVAGQELKLGEGTIFQAKNQLLIDAKDRLTNETILDYGNLDLAIRNSFINAKTGQLVQDSVLLTLRDHLDNAGTIYGRQKTVIEAGLLSNTDTGVIYGPEMSLNVAGSFKNLGQIVSERALKIIAGDILNDGTVQTDGSLNVKATSYRTNSSAAELAAKMTDLILSGALENSGQVLGVERLTLEAGDISNRNSIRTDGALSLHSLSYRAGSDSAVLSGATAALTVTNLFENKGKATASDHLALKAGSLSNLGVGSAITAADADLDIKGSVTNDGTVGGVSGLIVKAGGHVTSTGALLSSDGDLTLTAGGKIISGSDLIAKGAMAITATAFESGTTAARLGGTTITVDVSGAFSSLGLISGQTSVDVAAGSILLGPSNVDGTAGVLTAKSVKLTAKVGNTDNQGIVSGTDGLTASAAGTVINGGTLATDGELMLTAGAYRSTAQAQLGGKTVTLRLSGNLDNLGFISGSDLIDIQAASVSNGPTIIDTRAGQILAQTIKLGSAEKALGSLTNSGAIESAQKISFHTGTLVNSGSLIANVDALVSASGHAVNSGKIGSGSSLELTAGSYTATAGAELSSKELKITSDALDNSGTIYGSVGLTVESASLMNRGIASSIGGGGATIKAVGPLSNEGTIAAVKDLVLTAEGSIANAGSIMAESGKLTLNAASGDIVSTGVMAAAGALDVTASSFSSASQSAKLGGGTVALHLTGDFTNNGLVNGGADLFIKSRDISNGPVVGDSAGRMAGAIVKLEASGDITNQGSVEADTSLTITGGGGLTNSGTLATNQTLSVDVADSIINQSKIAGATLILKASSYYGTTSSSLNAFDLTVNLPGAFANAGRIDARGLLTLTAHEITNVAGGVIGAGGITLTAMGDLTNAGTVKSEYNGVLDIKGKLTNTGNLQALKSIKVTVVGAVDNSNVIQAAEKLEVTAGPITNRQDGTIQGKEVSLTSTGDMVNAGVISGEDKILIRASSLKNQGVSRTNYASISSKLLSVDVSGALTIGTNSLLQGTEKAVVNAQTVSAGFFKKDTIAEGWFNFGENLNFTLTQGGWTFDQDFKVKGDPSFTVAGNIFNHAVVAAGGTLTLVSTGGSITNGANNPSAPGGDVIYSGGNMVLQAHNDLNNFASVIQSGGNLTINVGDDLRNVRTAIKTVADGSAATGYPYDWKYTSFFTKQLETSGPSTIQADGSININAGTVLNEASTVAAGLNLTITANKIEHLARTLIRHETIIKTGGDTNVGQIFDGIDHSYDKTPALFYAGGTYAHNSNIYAQHGTVQADQIIIKSHTVTVGITNPNIGTAPSHIPDPVIDLADALQLLGAGLVPGSGPAYVEDPSASSGHVSGKSGDTLEASVDANGKPIKRPADKDVKVNGRVSFLYATPIASGQNERNPSWIFAQVNASAKDLAFFADPATERRLIQQALLEQTGRAILDPKYRNPKEQQEALYEATVDFLRENQDIKIGDTLTKAQRAKITKPILWYEYQVVNGKKVLVPQVILPEKDLAKYAAVTGGAMFANDISIQADKVTNTGTILAVNSLSIDANEFLNEKRVARSGELTALFETQAGGMLSAKTMMIATKGDLINRGGSIIASQGLSLTAGGSIRIEAQTITNSVFSGKTKNWSLTTDVTHVGGLVSSGGDLVMKAEKKLDILGSTVTAKGDALLVGKEGVSIASVFDEHDMQAGGKKNGLLSKSSFSASEHSLTNLSSVVSAGKNLTVRSETGNIEVAASHLMAKNDLAVLAGYDANGHAIAGSKASVHVLSEQDVKETAFSQKKSGVGLFFTGSGVDIYRSTKTANTSYEARNVASSLSADGDVTVKATRDIKIIGSVVAAKDYVTLDAKRDVIVGTGFDAAGSTSSKKEKGIGLTWSGGNGGFSVGAGYHASSQSSADDKVTVARSLIKGDKGVSVTAGDDIVMTAASVLSQGHVSLDAKDDIKLLAGLNRESSYQSSKEMFAGITLKVSQNVTGAAQQLQQSVGTFTSGYGGVGYRILGQVSGVLQATDALKSLTNPTASASLMLGASGSSSSSRAVAYNAVPTTIKGGTFGLAAGGDAHLVGTQITVDKDLLIDVTGKLTVESAQSYAETSSKAESWNAGVGLSGSLGASGVTLGLTVEGGFSKDKASSWQETQLNAHLSAGGKATLKTGGDATFAGAVVKSANIDADIGGNLTMASRQDTAHGSASAVNGSGSATIGIIGPSWVSVSAGGSRSTSDKAWVSEQTGLFATNKLDVYVEKHTQLNGAVLNADTGQLTLDTGTLGFSDILDHDTSTSISAQVGVTTPGAPGKLPGVSVQGSYASHDIEQVTQATVGAGTIIVRDTDKQEQDVKGINRDVDEAQVITKNEREGVEVYASISAVQEIASGFEGIQQNIRNFENLPANVKNGIDQFLASGGTLGKTVDKALGGILSQLAGPNASRVGAALNSGELDYKTLAKSLSNCGQQSFNLHDLLFAPAYASGGCPVQLSNGETVYLTKSEQDSCWYAAGKVALGILERGTIGHGAASIGFAAGTLAAAGSDLRAMGDLGGYAVALTYGAEDPRRKEAEQFFGAMRDQVVTMLKDPAGTLKGAAVEMINGVQDKAILYAQAAERGDYVAMGRIEGELAYEVGSIIASGGASGALGKGTLKALKSAVPKIAEAVDLGLGKISLKGTKILDANIKWGGGILDQGIPWEDYLAGQLPKESRLPANFKTFDFFDEASGVATSAKTLDTMTAAKLADPKQVYYSLKANIDDVLAYNKTNNLDRVSVNPDKIQLRELQVAVPQGTTAAQWEYIAKAISYAQTRSSSLVVKVTVVK